MATSDFQLSYLDFIPQCLKEWGFLSLPKYERFDVIVARANDWLVQNPGYKITNCESVDLPWRSYSPDRKQLPLDNSESLFYESGAQGVCYVRSLRIWIMAKSPNDDPNPVRLGYYNIVPGCIDTGGVFSLPKFESFDVTLGKVNELFRRQPLQGSIINIETQDMKFQTWGQGVDPDENFWFEHAKGATFFLNCLRIFYVGGPPALESIGCVDIVPTVTGRGRQIEGEPFGTIANRATAWITDHPGVKVTNVQSVNYKVAMSLWQTEVRGIDTMQTLYHKAGKGVTVFCRILRICYVMPQDGSVYQGIAPPVLTYRNFAPAMTRPPGSMLIYNPKYETVTQNMARLVSWLSHTRAHVLSVETARILLRRDGADAERTVTFDSGSTVDIWITVFRIYVNGYYTDPPLSSLPAPPPMEEPVSAGCCTLL